MSSADNLFKQFGPRSGPASVGPDLDPNCLILKEFYENVKCEKIQRTTKKHAKLPSMQRVNNREQKY